MTKEKAMRNHGVFLKKTLLTRGFTLVELSIVIIIVSLLMASGLAVGTSMVEQANYIDTKKKLSQIRKSLHDYYIVNGHLPCAARINLLPSDANFGRAVNCANDISGTEREGSPLVRIGMVPARTLGLTDRAASDAYGNRIYYAVTENLTNPDIFNTSSGGITVRDGSSMTGNTVTDVAAYVLISPGADRKGAYAYSNAGQANSCAAGNLDSQNCDLNNEIFRDAAYNSGDVASKFFDDIVDWAPRFHFLALDSSTESLWASSGVDPLDIYAVGTDGIPSTTDVGIGNSNPQHRLHVTGNVGVDGVYSGTSTDSVGISYTRTGNKDARITVGDNTARWSIASGWSTAGEFSLIQEGVSGNRIYVDSTGNVGLGISNPTRRLHVNGDAYTSGRIHVNSDAYVRGNVIVNNSSPTLYLQDTNHRTAMIHANSDRLYILRGGNNGLSWDTLRPVVINLNNGNVGIGTSSPGNALDVKGGKIRGQLDCTTVNSGASWGRATASCPSNRWLLSGGGWCNNGTQDALWLSRPNGNSWQAECYRHDGPWDAVANARAICCMD